MKRGKVLQDHSHPFDDILSLSVCDQVRLSPEKEPENGWMWCFDRRMKHGWIPKRILEKTGSVNEIYSLIEDYCSKEIDVKKGETVIIKSLEKGWYFVLTLDNRTGWVPITKIELIERLQSKINF